MPEVEYTQLDITLPGGEFLPNQFVRPGSGAAHLGILFPGLRYTSDMPLLYYTTRALLEHNTDVLQLRADYTTVSFNSLSGPERSNRISEDAEAILRAGLAQRDYQQVILVGKSIGTLGMVHLLRANPGTESALTIWQTPLFYQSELMEAALERKTPSLFIVGTGDSTYDPTALQRIREATGAEAVLIEGADHSLEIPGNLLRSIQAIGDVLKGVTGFLDKHLK